MPPHPDYFPSINLTTVKNYAGNKVVVVHFDPTTVTAADGGTTCTYPSTGGMFFLLKLEDGDAFARAPPETRSPRVSLQGTEMAIHHARSVLLGILAIAGASSAQLGSREDRSCGNVSYDKNGNIINDTDSWITDHIVNDSFPPNEYITGFVVPTIASPDKVWARGNRTPIGVAEWSHCLPSSAPCIVQKQPWTVQLSASEAMRHGIVKKVTLEPIRRLLHEGRLKPWRKITGCIKDVKPSSVAP